MQNYEKISPNFFNKQMEHQMKLKPDSKRFSSGRIQTCVSTKKAMKKIVARLAEADLITPTHSNWAALSILVPKKFERKRWIVVYRGLKNQIWKTSWPIPNVIDVTKPLEGNRFFPSIDLISGFFQLAFIDDSQNLTVFITPMRKNKWKRVAMGLSSARGAFQKVTKLVFNGFSYKFSPIALDGIIVFGKKFDEHLLRFTQIFALLEKNGLKIRSSKWKFFQIRTLILGQDVKKRSGRGSDEDGSLKKTKSPSN